LRIAFIGIRGVPANYGGFETFVEELGGRLVEAGHEVTVYGRDHWVPAATREYRGMRIVRLPAPRAKYFETVIHTLFAAFALLLRRFDVVYVCNSANVPAVIVLLAARHRVVLNVDGLEWRRAKWNRIGRLYYRACAWIAARLPAEIVTDALVIQEHYRDSYGRETTFFPYGTEITTVAEDGFLGSLDLQPGRFILYVSRLEPENNADVVIQAYAGVDTDLPLAVVGDAPYASDYIASLHAMADPRVRFLGAIYGHGYRVLQSNATVYVQATEVGGTHPALVEAMGFGNAILANDVPEHRETLGEAGRYYRGVDGLRTSLQELLAAPAERDRLARAAQARATELFGWDAIATRYEAWLRKVARR
jgi:glycosyltransferase involved in cell wall biosynthesis